MTESEQTKGYLDMATQTYGAIVETAASANNRLLESMKAMYEIVARPYTSTAVEATYRENIDRAGQLIELTVSSAKKTGVETAALAEKLSAQTAEWQEKYVEAMRGMFRTSLSNLAYVKSAADQTYEGFAKRIEEIQTRTADVSAN